MYKGKSFRRVVLKNRWSFIRMVFSSEVLVDCAFVCALISSKSVTMIVTQRKKKFRQIIVCVTAKFFDHSLSAAPAVIVLGLV